MPSSQVPGILVARRKLTPAFDLVCSNFRHLISGSLAFVSRYRTCLRVTLKL